MRAQLQRPLAGPRATPARRSAVEQGHAVATRPAPPVLDVLGPLLARSVTERATRVDAPLLARQGFSLQSYFNPFYYLPEALGGYDAEHMLEYTSPARLLPGPLPQRLRERFNLVDSSSDVAAQNDVTRAQYDEIAQLMVDIAARTTRLVISASAIDPISDAPTERPARDDVWLAAMIDLFTVAQTKTGRALLTAIARAPDDAPLVTINAFDLVVPPDASPTRRGVDFGTPQDSAVNYTPTPYRAGRASNAKANLENVQGLKRFNAWLMPDRSDVTLYHELVHARHYQTGTAKPKEALVTNPVDPVDAPKRGVGIMGEEATIGVPEEEYATVGLGDYAADAFTENRYRRQRRKLGEVVPKRGHYVEKHG